MRKSIDFYSIGDRLDLMRRLTNQSLKDVMLFLDTSKFIYKKVRFGEKLIPFEWVMRFVEKYGFSRDWIYTGDGEIFEPAQKDFARGESFR
jgi:hypothetical protein